MSIEQQIFQKGSTTYYFSSQFFPTKIRKDVFKLYSFVRVADDYVDAIPAQVKEFQSLRRAWNQAKNNPNFDTKTSLSDTINERVIKNIVYVMSTYNYEQAWIESFLDSMQADLDKKTYKTIEDTIWYMYGSAEVIGLMMARIMGLEVCNCHAAEAALLSTPVRTHRTKSTAPLRASPPPSISSLPDSCRVALTARLQGRSMQFINFLRDIDEDNSLGRCYFPSDDLKRFELGDLREVTVLNNQQAFKDFMHFELERYSQWQTQAATGFKYIPRRLRIPLQTAVDMYNWTGKIIADDPMVVFTRKVKPQKRRILARGIYNGAIIIPGF